MLNQKHLQESRDYWMKAAEDENKKVLRLEAWIRHIQNYCQTDKYAAQAAHINVTGFCNQALDGEEIPAFYRKAEIIVASADGPARQTSDDRCTCGSATVYQDQKVMRCGECNKIAGRVVDASAPSDKGDSDET